MNIVEKLITYRQTQKITELGLKKCFDKENLNVIVIEILSWLQLQHKRKIWIEQGRKAKLNPMKLNMNYPWCNELIIYMSQDNALSEYFSISENTLDFRTDISKEIVDECIDYAFDNYKPDISD